MDELVRTVSQKTGLSDDKSRMAIQAVTDYLKKKLPGPISGQIDTVLQGGSISDAARGVSGIMGRK